MSQATILLVDDEEGHIELVRRNLERSGVTNPLVALTNGKLAVDYVYCRGTFAGLAHNNDLVIILDVNMPGIDGVDVLRLIKSDAAARFIPVLMLSTTGDLREVNRCYALGCNAYITKPLNPARFTHVIEQIGRFITVMNTPVKAGSLP